jgi:hypothetical protein
VIEESFVSGSLAHHPMETRSAMAYWQGGKCILHGSNQSPPLCPTSRHQA